MEETNRYAEQTRASVTNPAENLRINKWKPVTLDEMKLYFAMVFAIGLVNKLELQEYWSNDEVLHIPWFKVMMNCDRFLLIVKFIHFNDNTFHIRRGQPGYDPLFTIRPIYDFLRKRFGEVYQPHKELSLDESAIGWRGNVHFKMYNAIKAHKFHVKAYVVA